MSDQCAAEVWCGRRGSIVLWRRCKRSPNVIRHSIWGDFPFCTQHLNKALSEGIWVFMPDEGTLFIEASDWKLVPLEAS